MRATSPGRLGVDRAQTPRLTARSSSARVLPTPVKTISSGVKPARSATSISPPELASAPRTERAHPPDDAERGVGLDGVVQPMRIRRQTARRARGSARRSGPRCRRGRRADAAGDRRRAAGRHSQAAVRGTKSSHRTLHCTRRASRGAVSLRCRTSAFAMISTSSLDAHRCPRSPALERHRRAHRALPAGRSGRVGPDRPAALAQGLQPGVQVRRPPRRGRGSDAGHLPARFSRRCTRSTAARIFRPG